MDRKKEQEKAKQQVIKFAQVWGWEYLDLASHAAFPLAVTPELLYLLRENFVPDCPWIAVSDLLLSPLCMIVGDELYEMEFAVRDLLLRRLATDFRFGETHLNQLAEFMSAYISLKLPESPRIAKDIGTEPQWIALAYIRPGDTTLLRQALSKLLRDENSKERERLATFLDTQEDLLIAAGLEPLIEFIRRETTDNLTDIDSELQTLTVNFETVFVDRKGEIIRRLPCQAEYFEESLGEGVPPLKMISIPAGEFMMGSPEGEKDSQDDEKPQHLVKVPSFFMSQPPITQAQWRFVASLPQERKN